MFLSCLTQALHFSWRLFRQLSICRWIHPNLDTWIHGYTWSPVSPVVCGSVCSACAAVVHMGLTAKHRGTCWCWHFSFLSNTSVSVLVSFLGQWASSTASEGLTCSPLKQMLQAANWGHFSAVAEALSSLLDQTMHFWRYQDVIFRAPTLILCGRSPKTALRAGFLSLFSP